jgi:hypothetical protein
MSKIDIVEKLRMPTPIYRDEIYQTRVDRKLMNEAATEIERLRKMVNYLSDGDETVMRLLVSLSK